MWTDAVSGFAHVGLEELDQLSLMNRTDTKYIFHERVLEDLLLKLQPYYRMLEIRQQRMMKYHSVYFDTPGHFLYHCHHNGKRARYKVRLRDYLVSDISFFEIKKKNNKNQTRKKRMQVPFRTADMGEDTAAFVTRHTPLFPAELGTSLENTFTRMTLAGFETQERITIDTEMSYDLAGLKKELPGLVIAEVKRSGHGGNSPVTRVLHELGVMPGGFSKYCMGIVTMQDGVKYNRFKPKINQLKKILL